MGEGGMSRKSVEINNVEIVHFWKKKKFENIFIYFSFLFSKQPLFSGDIQYLQVKIVKCDKTKNILQ